MILIKQHNSQQIAHLYEHLFCMAVDDFFYENKLFPYLDYDVTGHTLHGVVYVEVDFYTDEAKRLEQQLPNVEIAIDGRAFNVALIQLGSELQQGLGMVEHGNTSKKIILEELCKLDAQAWKNIKEVTTINARKTKLVPGSLYTLENKKEIPTKKIEISYTIDHDFAESHKELRPLFINVARLISANVRTSLYCQLGFYPDGVSYAPVHHATSVVHSFRVSNSLDIGAKDTRQVAQDAITELHEEKTFDRLMRELRHAASSDSRQLFPDPYKIYKLTDIIIGAEGWKQIATEDNCKIILSHMKLSIIFGHSSTSLGIAAMLDFEDHEPTPSMQT